MPNRRIEREVQRARALVAELQADGRQVADGLRARALTLRVSLGVDWAAALEEARTLLEGAIAAAEESDREHAVAAGAHVTPMLARDAAARTLYVCVGSVRRAMAMRYGEQAIQAAFPRGDTPKEPAALVLYAERAAAVLTAGAPSWKAQRPSAMPIDLAAAATQLRALAQPVAAAQRATRDKTSASHLTLVTRHAALATLREVRLGTQQMLLGALRAAGLAELAARATTHHHVHASASKPREEGAAPTSRTAEG